MSRPASATSSGACHEHASGAVTSGWRWDRLAHRPLHRLQVGAVRDGTPEIVLVPGLGALGYLRPLIRACAAWTRVHLLDVPGFGHARTAHCRATLAGVTADVAAWLDLAAEAVPVGAPVLLVGHSTGAQVALHATLARPARVTTLVLAGPTFPPEARRWRSLAARVARTVPHEHPGIVPVVAAQYLRGRTRVLSLLRTGMADAPDAVVGRVTCPVTVVRGARDAVCPAPWAATLAARAVRGRCLTVPGAHNFPYQAPLPAARALRIAARGGDPA